MARLLSMIGVAGAKLLIILVFFGTMPAYGAATILTVRDVPVDATAASATAAREEALRQGQREALRLLVERMTPADAHPRLPQLTDADVASALAGFSVAEEKISPTRYLGRLTVNFRAGAVRQLLKSAGLAYADQAQRPVLLVPLYAIGDTAIPWGQDNPWRALWQRTPTTGALQPWVVVRGDEGDAAAIDQAALKAGDQSVLQQLAQRYDGTDGVVIANATVGTDALAYSASQAGATLAEGTIPLEPGASSGAASLTPLLARALAAISGALDARRGGIGAVDYGAVASIEVVAEVDGFETWADLLRRLREDPRIGRAEPKLFTRRGGTIDLGYFGALDAVASSLASRGVVLQTASQPARVSLATASAAAVPAAQPAPASAASGAVPGTPHGTQ